MKKKKVVFTFGDRDPDPTSREALKARNVTAQGETLGNPPAESPKPCKGDTNDTERRMAALAESAQSLCDVVPAWAFKSGSPGLSSPGLSTCTIPTYFERLPQAGAVPSQLTRCEAIEGLRFAITELYKLKRQNDRSFRRYPDLDTLIDHIEKHGLAPESIDVKQTELTAWRDAGKEVPDADITVLVYSPDSEEQVWPGYYGVDCDGETPCWYDVSGSQLLTKVTHWAPMPIGPQV